MKLTSALVQLFEEYNQDQELSIENIDDIRKKLLVKYYETLREKSHQLNIDNNILLNFQPNITDTNKEIESKLREFEIKIEKVIKESTLTTAEKVRIPRFEVVLERHWENSTARMIGEGVFFRKPLSQWQESVIEAVQYYQDNVEVDQNTDTGKIILSLRNLQILTKWLQDKFVEKCEQRNYFEETRGYNDSITINCDKDVNKLSAVHRAFEKVLKNPKDYRID